MPIYIYQCDRCVLEIEKIQGINGDAPHCPKCGVGMTKKPTCPAVIKMGAPLWTNRVDDIHKAQSDRGERLRFVHPKEVNGYP